MFKYLISLLIGLIQLISVRNCLRFPENPCPDRFHYIQIDGIQYGDLKIPYDGNPTLNLGINVSMVGYFKNLKLKLELLTPQNQIPTKTSVDYRIIFPLQNVLPKLTHVTFNGLSLCNGPPEPLGMAGVTNLWAGLIHQLHSYTYTVRNGVREEPVEQPQHHVTTVDNTAQHDNNRLDRPNLAQNPFFSSITIPSSSAAPPSLAVPSSQQPVLPTYPKQTVGKRPIITTSSTQRTVTIAGRGQDNENCGIANEIQSLILNGERTTDNEYPWLVALFYRKGISYEFQCTANLISKNHVITAAHCVQFHKAPLIPKDDLLLILGQSNLTHWAASGATIRTVSDVMVHPDYRQFSGHCDAAIIRLNEPITYKVNIRPICLWDGDGNLDRLVEKSGVVSGWGRDEHNRQTVPELRKVNMPIVSQDKCLRSNPGFFNLTSEVTFCAGNRDGSGPCTGDSGGGFMIQKNKKWTLRGLVSTAIKNENTLSCNLNEYVVFSDIAKMLNWIKACINK